MAELFRALTALPELDLRVHHVLSSPPGRPWQVPLTDGYCERSFQLRFGLDWELIRAIATEKHSFFLSASWGDLTNQVCIVIATILGRHYALFNDAPNVLKVRHPMKAVLRGAFLRFAFRHADAVLGTGEPTLRILETMGCPKEKLVNFPYFVEPGEFSLRERWYDGAQPLAFVSSGRLVPEKAYGDCIEALGRVFQRTGMAFRYRIMGTGPEMERLQELAVAKGIGEFVEFLGWVDPAQSRDVFESGDVFLHPSEFEPFGVVVAEAMAASLVVIASDKTYAALDRITDSYDGFLYRTGDIDQLCEKIQLLIGQPELIQPIGKRARSKAEEWPLTRAQTIIKSIVNT